MGKLLSRNQPGPSSPTLQRSRRSSQHRQIPSAASATSPEPSASSSEPGAAKTVRPKSKRRKARTAQQGADVQLVLQLKLREAALGAKKDLVAKVMRPCVVCVGLGAEPGSIIQECTVCQGVGEVTKFTGGSAGVTLSPTFLNNDAMTHRIHQKDLSEVVCLVQMYKLLVLFRAMSKVTAW